MFSLTRNLKSGTLITTAGTTYVANERKPFLKQLIKAPPTCYDARRSVNGKPNTVL